MSGGGGGGGEAMAIIEDDQQLYDWGIENRSVLDRFVSTWNNFASSETVQLSSSFYHKTTDSFQFLYLMNFFHLKDG